MRHKLMVIGHRMTPDGARRDANGKASIKHTAAE
jgi:hypothetical protein